MLEAIIIPQDTNSSRDPFCNFRPKLWTIEKPVFPVLSESDVDSIAPESGWSSSKRRILGERGSNLEMADVGKYFTARHLRHVTYSCCFFTESDLPLA